MKNVAIICTIAAVACFGLSWANQRSNNRLATMGGEANQCSRSDVGEVTTCVKVYDEDAANRAALKANYPELFSTEAIIVYFGSKDCPACVPHKAILKSQVSRYNIAFYDVATSRGVVLLHWFKLDIATPQTLIIEKGKVAMTFRGYTPWNTIRKSAKKAKKVAPAKLGQRLRERSGNRLDDFLERFQPLRETLSEWYGITSKWVAENWDMVLRVIVMVFAFI